MLKLKNTLDGYLKNVEVIGNTIQDKNNLANIRSVGDKVEGQELYKIDVVSCGKNLYNPNKVMIGNITENGDFQSVNNQILSDFIKVKSNNYYIHSLQSSDYVVNGFIGYDSNKNFVKFLRTSVDIIDENIKFVRVRFRKNNSNPVTIDDVHIAKPQLEEGRIITAYEPYQEQKLEILSPVQLEKVGDVADRIICKDGVWGVEKNITKVNLKDLSFVVYSETNDMIVFNSNISIKQKGNFYGISNKLIYSPSTWNNLIIEDSIGLDSTSSRIFVKFRKSTISTLKEFNKFKEDLFLLYQRDVCEFISLPHDQQVKLRTFAGQTNIAFLTEIAGQIKAQVPKSLGATVNTHTEQIADLHNSLDRVKKLEETTVSTIETESSFTTVDATSNGYFEDVKLEGKTLVNLIPKYSKGSGVWGYATFESDEYGYVKANATGSWLQLPRLRKTSTNIKPGTEYTLVLDIKSNTLNSIFEVSSSHSTDFIFRKSIQIDPGKSGVFTFLVKSVEDITNCVDLFRSQLFYTCTEGTIVYRYSLLEGDHTNNPPSYFEGLMSVGQDVEEVSVESVNENLISKTDLILNASLDTNGNQISHVGRVCTDFIRVPSNCNLYFRGTNNSLSPNRSYVCFYDKDKNVISSRIQFDDFKILTPHNCRYVRFITHDNSLTNLNDVVYELYIGSLPNQYTYHQSNKKPLLYFNPTTETWEKPILREWDTIEKHSDGKYYYHKRSGEVVLNGSESDWSQGNLNGVALFSVDIGSHTGSLSQPHLCDKFSDTQSYAQLETTEYGMYSNSTRIYFRPSSNVSDLVGFKAWLKANPTTVVYQLAQEEIYECTNIDLMTYSKETNYIINSGAISPKSLLKVHNNISNVVKILQEKVSLLENTFIAGLKSVLSGDMYSLATILYPEDFEQNDNTEQDIMVIPE